MLLTDLIDKILTGLDFGLHVSRFLRLQNKQHICDGELRGARGDRGGAHKVFTRHTFKHQFMAHWFNWRVWPDKVNRWDEMRACKFCRCANFFRFS